VSDLSHYIIPLKSIVSYNTTYDYELEESFFSAFVAEDGIIRGGNVKASIDVKKLNYSFELSIKLNGFVSVLCDRCLDVMEIQIDDDSVLVVKFGETYTEVDEELVIVPEKEGVFNIAWYLYESLVLILPLQRIHQDGGCNKEMEKNLQKYSTDITVVNEKIDPRWEALKNIK